MRIAIPVEVKVRDLKGVIWLSIHLIEKGHNVVIGETFSIRNGIDVIKPDVLLYPGLSNERQVARITTSIKNSGGHVFALDTEGGVYLSDREFVKKCDAPRLFRKLDRYFAWGEKPAQLLTESTDLSRDQVQVTGHPRFDLLKEDLRDVYRTEVESILQRYGRYFLVNTNFNVVNNPTKVLSAFDSELVRYQQKLFDGYIDMLRRLGEDFPDQSLIVRPHPIEDKRAYSSIFEDNENVHIQREGDVIPWIMGADTVIHKSSTTGIESALLETPVISYRPATNEHFDATLPISVSEEHTEYAETRDSLRKYAHNDQPYRLDPTETEHLSKFIRNIDDVSATESISDAIDSYPDPGQVSYDDLKPTNLQKLRRISNRFLGAKNSEKISSLVLNSDFSGVRQKFPGLTVTEVCRELERFNQNIPSIDITVEVTTVPELRNTFKIHQRK